MMKKLMGYIISTVAFLFLFTCKVSAQSYNGALGYEYSFNSTKFYFYIQNEDIDYIDLYINDSLVTTEHMIKDDSGIYYADIQDNAIEGGLNKKEYYYNICYKDSTCIESIDPFATTINMNGDRNVILDSSAYNIDNWDYLNSNMIKNPIIYSIDGEKFTENINGPFVSSEQDTSLINSVFEKLVGKTKYMDRDIGYNYIIRSGINYLEIGNLYDENNYFYPNHEYSSKENNIDVISELKHFIKGYKSENINIILRTNFITLEDNFKNNLTKLSLNYVDNGKINLNDEMMQKYILDVYKNWIKEYKVDGFYIEDSNLYPDSYLSNVINTLKSINSNLIIYTDDSSDGEYYTSDKLQTLLLGDLSNNSKEGILNETFSAEIMEELINSMFGGYYNDLSKIKNGSKIINNLGSMNGLDVYSKLRLISGLGTQENILSTKIKLAFYTLYSSIGIPRIISGNEFLNTTTIPTSDIAITDPDTMVCNNSNSICYAIGDNKHISWDYLVKNNSILNILSSFRNRYTNYYPNSNSLNASISISYNKELLKLGVIQLYFDYDANNNGDIDDATIVINYSGKDISIEALENRNKESFYTIRLVGAALLGEEDTKISAYGFIGYSNVKLTKLPNWAYILIAIALFGIIFGLRSLFVYLLKTKKGIDYNEYSKTQRKSKKTKKEKVKEASVFQTYLGDEPILNNLKNKAKKDKKKQDKESFNSNSDSKNEAEDTKDIDNKE